MALSLERLQTILRVEDKGDKARARPHRNESFRGQGEESMDSQTFRHELFDRPIPEALFRCPISLAQTTLVQWNSLPKKIQEQVLENHPRWYNVMITDKDNSDLDHRAVEIPKSYLQGLDSMSEEQQRGSHSPRPGLQGNLRDKLTEYTRGLTGQARPFLPGGGVSEDFAEREENPYRSPTVMALHQMVLERWPNSRETEDAVVEQMWNDGLLLNAPLGVDFEVGLSIEGLRPDSVDHVDAEKNLQESSLEADDKGSPKDLVVANDGSSNLFDTDAAYFVQNEIDSLFGSSSGTGSLYEEEDDEDGDNAIQKHNPENNADTIELDILVVRGQDETPVPKPEAENKIEEDREDEEEVDIDVLLSELTASVSGGKQKPVLKDPLSIVERQALDQQDSARKVWANTKLLPIDDFDAFLPNPALTYPFTLDGFQQQAIARLERSENVFVAAHTSAGKTVVAEYAVALALQRSTRCVYTSPIKALSNQKFRDFSLKFGAKNVGLITGDLQVNAADSTCLIMTTEILRSMLYRGADLIRDIEYVIFDEVHYINDSERGVVWEEVIIMLPAHVTMVFLSATTPNTIEFSDWIGRTKRKTVNVVSTYYRPVPLSYNLWAGNDLHKILEGKSGFIEKGYRDAVNALLPASAKDPKKKDDPKKSRRPATGSKTMAWQVQGDKSNWVSLVNYLDRYVMTPTVVFSFSKKKCEEIARMLQSVDLNTAKERSAAQGFTLQAVSRLSQNDAKLPQVQMICDMVQRGIGVHHGGLLPILKECVEILFSRNLIKILLATETFAMGVNMPAKAVVFNSLRKHDGSQFRNLEPGEMTQMAGRAGRRGLDDVGVVIICCYGEEPPPENILRQVLTGSSMSLRSQFRLTYNMILNLLRVEEMSVESMIKRSFSEFATQRALTANNFPHLLKKGRRSVAKLEKQLATDVSNRVGAEDLDEYFNLSKTLLSTHRELLGFIHGADSSAFEDLLSEGRVLLVSAARGLGVVRGPGVVLKVAEERGRQGQSKKNRSTTLVCMLLLPSSYSAAEPATSKKAGSIGYVGKSKGRHYSIQRVGHGQILLVLDRKVKIDPHEILKEEEESNRRMAGVAFFGRVGEANMFSGMKAVGKKKQNDTLMLSGRASEQVNQEEMVVGVLQEVEKGELSGNGGDPLDLKQFVRRGKDILHFREACQRIQYIAPQIRSLSSHRYSSLETHYLTMEKKDAIEEKVLALQHFLSNESLSLFPDFLQRKAVLQKLGYLNENETVFFKGRVACEVNTCEELIATEMVFEGLLDDLKPEEIAAALSALVFQEKNEADLDSELPDALVDCCEKMKTIATNLGQVQKDAGLQVDPGEYRDNSLKFGLVHVVYEWALGVTFKNICQLTDIQEGSIVRCITRLDELCREIRNCARVVGNPSLYRRLDAASEAIKRDIVFASSLYVS